MAPSKGLPLVSTLDLGGEDSVSWEVLTLVLGASPFFFLEGLLEEREVGFFVG